MIFYKEVFVEKYLLIVKLLSARGAIDRDRRCKTLKLTESFNDARKFLTAVKKSKEIRQTINLR